MKYTKRTSTDWDALGREWHHRASLSAHRVEGAERAIHFTSVPLLKRHLTQSYRAGLRRDSLNNLTALHARLQHPAPQPLPAAPLAPPYIVQGAPQSMHATPSVVFVAPTPPFVSPAHYASPFHYQPTQHSPYLYSMPPQAPPFHTTPVFAPTGTQSQPTVNCCIPNGQAGLKKVKPAPTNKRGGKGTVRICRECREKECKEDCSKKAERERKALKKSMA